jgi:hypothetical protein
MKKDYKPIFDGLKKEGNYYHTYNLLISSPYWKDHFKVLLTVMLSDISMNGRVQWCHNTYADKIGKTRHSVLDYFRQLEELQILVPSEDNKKGSKYNTYDFKWHTFKEICNSKPVKRTLQPVKSTLEPVKTTLQTCKDRLTDTDTTDMLQKSNILEEKTSLKDVSPKEIEALMHEITKTI